MITLSCGATSAQIDEGLYRFYGEIQWRMS